MSDGDKCIVPECELRSESAHERRYDEIENTEGRMAAEAWDDLHVAWMECDDCGRADGSHDYEVEH